MTPYQCRSKLSTGSTRIAIAIILASLGGTCMFAPGLLLGQESESKSEPSQLTKDAILRLEKGDFRGAEELLMKCLAIDKEHLGPLHPNTAKDLGNLGTLYIEMSRFAEAERLLLKSLQILKTTGKDDPDVATYMQNLAGLYEATFQYTEAEPLYHEALAIQEKMLGGSAPDIATTINNLGMLYHNIGVYGKAETLFLRAQKIFETANGLEDPDTAMVLSNLALLYCSTGRYSKAESTCRQALAIREKVHPPLHPAIAMSLNNLAELYRSTGRYGEAEKLLQRALRIQEEAHRTTYPDTASVVGNLGLLYQNTGRYQESELLHLRSLEVLEAAFGPEHPVTATVHLNLGLLYHEMGRLAKAEEAFEHALKIVGNPLESKHPATVKGLIGKVALYIEMGRFAEAGQLAMTAAKIVTKEGLVEAEAHVEESLGFLREAGGQYAEAEIHYSKALGIHEQILGAEHPTSAQTLGHLGRLYLCAGRYAEAESILRRAIKIAERMLGQEHTITATLINQMGQLYDTMGSYVDAEPLLCRAVEIQEKAAGSLHPMTANSLGSLAQLYFSTARFEEAEFLHLRALAIRERSLGSVHPATAASLQNLADIYGATGRFPEAEEYYNRALRIREAAFGQHHPVLAGNLNNLAYLYEVIGQPQRAEPLYIRALKIRYNALGADHPDTAASLNNLALLYRGSTHIPEFMELMGRTASALESGLGVKHPTTAIGLNNLAALYRSIDDYPKAELYYGRALEIQDSVLGPEHPDTALTLENLAELFESTGRETMAEPLLKRACAIREKKLGELHPQTARTHSRLASLYWSTGRSVEAIDSASQSSGIEVSSLRHVLTYFSEVECLTYARTLRSKNLAGTWGSARIACLNQLQTQGLVMETIGMRRRLEFLLSDDLEAFEILRERKMLEASYQKLLLEQGENSELAITMRKRLEDLDKGLNLLFRRVFGAAGEGVSIQRIPPEIELNQVSATLSAESRLVQVFRYQHRLTGDQGFEQRYGCTVVGSQKAAEPDFVALGKADVIDQAIAEFRYLARPVKPGDTSDPRAALKAVELNENLRTASKRLFELLWLPLKKAGDLPSEVNTVVISADSQLHFLPFGLLSADGERFLCQDYTIRYVNSGRDLVNAPTAVIAGTKKALLVGNPLYGDNVPQRALAGESIPTTTLDMNLRTGMAEDTRGLSFAPLPGTSTEIALLKSLLEKAGYDTGTLDGRAATEANVHHNVQSPAILHFATHGFFLPEPEQETSPRMDLGALSMTGDRNGFGLARVQNPMYRSGLALAGAETTRKMWEKGNKSQIPPSESDGILLAAEAATLDLRGTELVVLSACSTAEGKALDGEGVMGLRRALAVAGARNVVMSLWAVEDDATVEFMKRFYPKLLGGNQPAIALHETMRELLLEGMPTYGLQGAISRYGAFIATSMGALPK